MLRALLGSVVLIGCLMLSGCSTFSPTEKPPQPTLSKAMRTQALQHLHTFRLAGTLAIRTPHEAGSLHWQWHQKAPCEYVLTLQGPLGTGAVRLEGQPHKVILLKTDGKKITARNPDQLLLQETGWRLPVSGFYYWVRSLPVPHQPAHKTYDQNNRISQLKQQGWHIRYLHYRNINGLDLPDKMTLTTASVSLKVAVSQWQP